MVGCVLVAVLAPRVGKDFIGMLGSLDDALVDVFQGLGYVVAVSPHHVGQVFQVVIGGAVLEFGTVGGPDGFGDGGSSGVVWLRGGLDGGVRVVGVVVAAVADAW